MKIFLCLPLFILLISCNEKPSLQYEDGWHKAYVKMDKGNAEAAMVQTRGDIIDSICFSSGKCIGNFLGNTIFQHSQNVQVMNSKEGYTVYIIPDEWDQTKELFEKKKDEPDYQ